MKVATAILLLFLAGCSHTPVIPPTPPPVNKDWTVNATFTYNFTNYLTCSATVTTGCVASFTWGYLQGTTQVPLKTSLSSICTGTAQPEACADSVNSQLPIGSLTFYLVTNYVTNAGAVASTPAVNPAAPTTVAAGEAANFAVTVQ